MNIRLSRPPTVISAPKFAADIASWVRERFRVELDYSVESLATVDELLVKLRADRVSVEKVGETLWCLGCYVGEVFVRHANAEWKDDELPDVAQDSGALWLARGGHWINPIGKVVRVASGEPASVLELYRAFAAATA